MKNFEDYRNDRGFNLESLSFEQIFAGLKSDLKKIISDMEEKEIFKLELSERNCSTRSKYGKDGFLYPIMILSFDAFTKSGFLKKDYYLEIAPSEIDMLVNNGGRITKFINAELDEMLMNFMQKQFNNSGYIEKRKKYVKDSNVLEKKYDEMLYF